MENKNEQQPVNDNQSVGADENNKELQKEIPTVVPETDKEEVDREQAVDSSNKGQGPKGEDL